MANSIFLQAVWESQCARDFRRAQRIIAFITYPAASISKIGRIYQPAFHTGDVSRFNYGWNQFKHRQIVSPLSSITVHSDRHKVSGRFGFVAESCIHPLLLLCVIRPLTTRMTDEHRLISIHADIHMELLHRDSPADLRHETHFNRFDATKHYRLRKSNFERSIPLGWNAKATGHKLD